MRFISVDLPDPDGPMMATYSPRSIWIDTPRSAWISSEPIYVGLPEIDGFNQWHRQCSLGRAERPSA